MKSFLFVAAILMGVCPALFSQDFNKYQLLVSEGRIPDQYLISSAKKYEKEIESIHKEDVKKKEKKSKKQFALESNFWEDDLLQSGLVLFNDEVSKYLGEVMNLLLAEDPGLREKVNVYALRSTEVNAFATDRGNIYVTLGMLAQLEDEAQLAYILSHELVHFNRKHSLDLFLAGKKMRRSSSRSELLNNAVVKDALYARNSYSKELESQADEEGLELFLNTSYATSTLNTVFDVLRYGYLPFDNIPFDHSILESEYYRIPEKLKLEKVQLITGEEEDADDQKSTHPNIAKRRKALGQSLTDVSAEGRQTFLISEERFKLVRQMSRYEIPMLYLHRDRPADAVYSAFLLKQTEPASVFLDKIIAKALYLVAKYKNYPGFSYPSDPDKIEGESQQAHYLLHHIDAKEACVLALRYTWSRQQQYPDDPELPTILSDLFIEFAQHFPDLSPFPNQAPLPPDSLEATEDPNASKYEKIRRQKAVEGDPEEYWKMAFIDMVDHPDFQNGFETGLAEHKERSELDEYYRSSKGKREYRKFRKRGLSLGIDHIVLVNPFFLKLDTRKEPMQQYIPTEVGQERFRELAKELAPLSGLKVQILDVCALRSDQTDRFNDIRMLNDWFYEQVQHLDLSYMPGWNQEQINAIAEKYGTDYFLWTGVIAEREPDPEGIVLTILTSLIVPILTPFAVYNALKNRQQLLYYAILFDVRTGKREIIKFDFIKRKVSDTLLKAQLYDTMKQISTE